MRATCARVAREPSSPSFVCLVIIAGRPNSIPSRTRPLNAPAPMVLHCGRVGRRQAYKGRGEKIPLRSMIKRPCAAFFVFPLTSNETLPPRRRHARASGLGSGRPLAPGACAAENHPQAPISAGSFCFLAASIPRRIISCAWVSPPHLTILTHFPRSRSL
jgi:hypothetical protein